MEDKALLGVDIGTQGTKVVLTNLEGAVLSEAHREYGVIHPRPGWAEQWPQVWEEAVYQAIRECLQKAKVSEKKVAAVGLTGLFGGAGIPVNRNGEPLRPCIIWLDRRAVDEVAWVRKNTDVEEILRVTGNFVDAYFGFPKIMWIKKHEPDIWQNIYKLLPPTTYIAFKLTGQIAMDFSTAANIGGVFDIRNLKWSEELCSALGIPLEVLPDNLVESTTVVGEITYEAERKCGLRAGTPVVIGGIDAPVATLAAGALKEGENVAMIGTSTCWGVVCCMKSIKTFSPSFIKVPYVIHPQDFLYVAAGTDTSGALLGWFRDHFGQPEVDLAGKEGVSVYALLDSRAAEMRPGSEGLLVLPYFMGERAPLWDSSARGAILGLTLFHTKVHIYRALLEAIGYSLRHCIEEAETTGLLVESKCRVVGGLAKSNIFLQILADILGRSIVVPHQYIGAPFGAAMLAGLGVRSITKDDIAHNWIAYRSIFEPRRDVHVQYDTYFRLFKRLYDATKDVMHALAELQEHV